MKRKFVKILAVIIYYLSILSSVLMDSSNILAVINPNISDLLFITLLCLPLIFKYMIKCSFLKVSICCFTILLLYIFVIEIITRPYKEFSPERWNNNKFCKTRHVMIDNLKDQYKLKEKSVDEIYKLLGKPGENKCDDWETFSKKSSYHELCYEIGDEYDKYIFFCFSFDENGYVEETYRKGYYD